MSGFTLYAAVDLSGGRAVRLRQGERSAIRVVANDPAALAARLADNGAPFLHVVDLDAAFGGTCNDGMIEAIMGAVSCPVQVGGGVRTWARAHALREAGAARVVLGTGAVRDEALLDRLLAAAPDGVVVAADARAGRVVISGWTEDGGETVPEFARRMKARGVEHLLVTTVERDGTGDGPDHAVLGRALDAFGAGVIASGGIGSVTQVAELAPLAARGLAGVVVGSLLVDGRASIGELLAATRGW